MSYNDLEKLNQLAEYYIENKLWEKGIDFNKWQSKEFDKWEKKVK